MYHTLFELQEKEKNEKNKPKTNDKFAQKMSSDKSPEDNYYGKGNKAYDHYNKKKSEDNNEKFEKTKNKIKLVVYKNGFILNNGPFRDRTIPENNKFMEEVEKGNIPEEIISKGITDLGILLVNRKTETYYPPIPIPITQITQITQINPINPITINPINQFNQLNQYNQEQAVFNYPYQYQYPYQFQNPYNIINDSYGYTVMARPRSKTQVWNMPPQTPMGTRNVRNNIFMTNTQNRNDFVRIDKYTSSIPKKDINKLNNDNTYNKNNNDINNNKTNTNNQKNNETNNNNINTNNKKTFETFHNLKQMEYLKEEEERKRKEKEKQKNKMINKKDEKNEKEEKEKEKEEKKFTAFGGQGKAIGNVNLEGLNVIKDIKNSYDVFKPICSISVRLFNGEIIKCDFNYSQTLRDIYYYIRKISGSNNFTLLDGFPPKPLRDYDRTIGELRLENTILTQRINN